MDYRAKWGVSLVLRYFFSMWKYVNWKEIKLEGNAQGLVVALK